MPDKMPTEAMRPLTRKREAEAIDVKRRINTAQKTGACAQTPRLKGRGFRR